jgi:hypothetical protein
MGNDKMWRRDVPNKHRYLGMRLASGAVDCGRLAPPRIAVPKLVDSGVFDLP